MTAFDDTQTATQAQFDTELTPKERRKLRVRRFFGLVLPLGVIGLAVAGTIGMGALKPKPEKKEDVVKAVPVLVASPVLDDVVLKVSVQGEVQPRTEINLVPQVSGKITYMSPKFIEGGKFKRGDLLARIDPREYELRVVQARANVAQAETVVLREESEGENARRDWEELGRSGSPTPLTLRKPQLAEAKAQLESAKAQLSEAELRLSRTALYAPFSGRVTQRHVDQGEFVTSGTKLGRIYSTAMMDVRFPLTNDELRRVGLTLGFEASKSTPAIPVVLNANVAGVENEWEGKIVRTDSMFDATTRVLYAYAEVKNTKSIGSNKGTPLAPGIFVNAQIQGESYEDVTVVPRAALRGNNKVYIANDDGTLSIKTVSVISSNRREAILESGVTLNETVITSPIRGVADGMKIQIVQAGELQATTLTEAGAE